MQKSIEDEFANIPILVLDDFGVQKIFLKQNEVGPGLIFLKISPIHFFLQIKKFMIRFKREMPPNANW